jgi:hypothetical protein
MPKLAALLFCLVFDPCRARADGAPLETSHQELNGERLSVR